MASTAKTIKSSFTIENLLARPHKSYHHQQYTILNNNNISKADELHHRLTEENVQKFNEFQQSATISFASEVDGEIRAGSEIKEVISNQRKLKTPESSFTDENLETSSDGIDDRECEFLKLFFEQFNFAVG